ncbi:glycosyl hydrolase, family 35, partial [Enterococcus faecium]|nr:glycosyl hydrolase, family 35 [Enterococcus faecium]
MYRTTIKKDAVNEKLRIIDGRDRVHVFLDEEKQAIQYQTEIGETIPLTLEKEDHQIDLLFENMGRVNYGHKLLADTQRKGIRTGVMSDLHFITEWTQY